MNRVVEPEILDELKPSDPRAIRARRDLRRINHWMGNARYIARSLRTAFPTEPPKRLVEIGTGDGTLLLRVAAKLGWPGQSIELKLIDREPALDQTTLAEYAKLGWKVEVIAADVFDWIKRGETSDCIIANLFLHHFSEEQLRMLLREAAQQTHCVIACEPPRSKQALLGCRLMPLIGIGEVALYDAAVSIRAGFRDRELSRIWPEIAGWTLREGSTGVFSHLFVARRS